jgi:transposase-like protein
VKKTRRHLTRDEKVAVLRRHLIDKQAVSDICEAAGIQPSQFYRWLKQFFENGALALERNGGKDAAVRGLDARRVEKLEAKLRAKNAVIADLLEEHVALKKSLGED